MSRNYLPRTGARVLAALLPLAAAAACGDPAGPGGGPRSGLGPGGRMGLHVVALPPDSALPLRVAEFTVRLDLARPASALRVIVDAGAGVHQVV